MKRRKGKFKIMAVSIHFSILANCQAFYICLEWPFPIAAWLQLIGVHPRQPAIWLFPLNWPLNERIRYDLSFSAGYFRPGVLEREIIIVFSSSSFRISKNSILISSTDWEVELHISFLFVKIMKIYQIFSIISNLLDLIPPLRIWNTKSNY